MKTPNPKCRLFLKITLVYALHITPSPLTPVTHCKDLYLFTKGGGGEVNWREGRGALLYKRGQKYQNDRLYLQSINSIKHQ